MTTPQDVLLAELFGTTCRCGRPKSTRRTFCGRCYHQLPREQQLALYQLLGEGYEEAYAAAVALLDREGPRRPTDAAPVVPETW